VALFEEFGGVGEVVGFCGEVEDACFLVGREEFGVGFEDHADEGEGVDVFAGAFEAIKHGLDEGRAAGGDEFAGRLVDGIEDARIVQSKIDGTARIGFHDVMLEGGCDGDGSFGIPEDRSDDLRATGGEEGKVDFVFQ